MNGPLLLDELPRLVAAGLITSDQADRIIAHYRVVPATASAPAASASVPSPAEHSVHGNRLMAVFGVLGSLLISLGLVLVVAHNWDHLSRGMRTVLAFAPLLMGQALLYHGLRRHPLSAAWAEGPAVLVAGAVAACVALVAQIYHVGGSLEGYLLTVGLLILGLCHVPGSAVVGLGYLSVITWYAVLMRSGSGDELPFMWIPLFAAFVPAAVQRIRNTARPVAASWTAFATGIALAVGAHLFYQEARPVLVIGVAALASAYALTPWLLPKAAGTRGLARIGHLALVVLLYYFGSHTMLEMLVHERASLHLRDAAPLALLVLAGIAAYALAWKHRKPFSSSPSPEGFVIIAVLYFLSTVSTSLTAVLANVLLLALGVWYVKEGSLKNALLRMNFGLVLIASVIIGRFFEVDASFVVRGLLFIAIGIAFLLLNLRMLRSRNPQVK